MRCIILFIALLFIGCQSPQRDAILGDHLPDMPKMEKVSWSIVDSIDVDKINGDIKSNVLTVDIGIYYPSNFDPTFDKVPLQNIIDGFIFAKNLFAQEAVQLNLLWVKSGAVDPKYFTIRANEIPTNPGTEYVNFYRHRERQPSQLTEQAMQAFNSIVEPDPLNDRTIYLTALQDVYFPFFERVEGERNWIIKSVRTSALSFPPYIYTDALPRNLRGIISLTNLAYTPNKTLVESRKTIAHELGHKLMNVSHEYLNINPEHEIFEEGGLMIYGSGLDIPSGEAGRWHGERLVRSPFLYKLNNLGEKIWNPDFEEGGHYYDPIYENYVIEF